MTNPTLILIRRLAAVLCLGTSSLFSAGQVAASDSVGLVAGLSEANLYGFSFNGVSNRREKATFTFEGSSEPLTLTLAAYDIDVADEISVYLNGNRIGYLATTANNGTEITNLPINSSDQNSGVNTLEFRQKRPGWRWGVTDIILTVGCNYPLVQN